MLQTYSVIIPTGVRPGQDFMALLGGQVTMITVPYGKYPNDEIYVQIPIPINENSSVNWPKPKYTRLFRFYNFATGFFVSYYRMYNASTNCNTKWYFIRLQCYS